jgi:threonine/homoserine/homoserine lactone efflux protein
MNLETALAFSVVAGLAIISPGPAIPQTATTRIRRRR